MFRSLFNDGGQVSAPTVFSYDVENACIFVNALFNVLHDVFVTEVFENVASETGMQKSKKNEMKEWIRDDSDTYTSVAICFLWCSLIFSKLICLHA